MNAITLPKPVGDFVDAINAHDLEAVLATFTADAIVGDDGHTHTDPAAVRAWVTNDLIAAKVVITPTSYENGRMIADSDAEVPGGPWVFAYDFVLTGDLISGLTIALA